uniref:Uncharacterized protein n=1 Tax=Rhizophora mucronata TaxID=61149 RepID=A0A2P2PFA0_RHIMU
MSAWERGRLAQDFSHYQDTHLLMKDCCKVSFLFHLSKR